MLFTEPSKLTSLTQDVSTKHPHCDYEVTMKQKHFSPLIVLIILILLSFSLNNFAWSSTDDPTSDVSAAGWATPPDWDSTSESDCRVCHEDLDRFPQLANSNPDKHHLLLGSQIQAPVIAPYASEGDTYECLSCHYLIWSEATLSYIFEDFRDCLLCHPRNTVTGNLQSANIHHETQTFYSSTCSTCHEGGHR